jgi:manganese-dependent ADP-ribose/CDP-alcohol diphosphatase
MRLIAALILILLSYMNIPVDRGSGGLVNAGQNQKPLFSFGIIADVQYADSDPAGTRYYRASLSKLREAVNTFRKDSVDFVITLGDMIDKDIRSFDPLFDILDSSGLRFYHVTGNHDYSVEKKYKMELPSEYSSRPGYYSVISKDFRLIFLNGNEISTYSSNNKTIIRKANALLDSLKKRGDQNAMEWNGGISDKQLLWFDNQMNEAKIKNEKVLIFCHFPILPENVHNLINYREVLLVLKKYQNTVAWFNGHNHSGNYGSYDKIHFVTMKGMVESENQNSFARIDVYRNKILIIGSGREESRILPY